ncbi:MAG: hypothetical protein PHH77_12010 [Victivallaceae bacterium]|nr:hypothetical protein [Victivallaceae bacterium]
MKKRIRLVMALLTSIVAIIPAYGAGVVSKCQDGKLPLDDWTFFQIGIWFDVPSSTSNSNVYGLKTGQPFSSGIGRVYGAEISWLAAATDDIIGVQGSWVSCFNEELKGIQAALGVCFSKKELQGLQASSVNICGNLWGIQAGAVNVGGNIIGLQAAAAVNCGEDINGAQFAFINVCNELTGLQASFVNSAQKSRGVQLGFINMSRSSGIQFGFLNFIKDGFVPWFPVLNIKF